VARPDGGYLELLRSILNEASDDIIGWLRAFLATLKVCLIICDDSTDQGQYAGNWPRGRHNSSTLEPNFAFSVKSDQWFGRHMCGFHYKPAPRQNRREL
jgi:hypothetical protein